MASDFGWDLKPEQAQSEIIKAVLPKKINREIKGCLYDNPKFALLSPLTPGIIDVLGSLKQRGQKYFLISRRKIPKLAIALLEKYGLWPLYFNKKNSFFVEKKSDKNKKSKELGVTHYIDDQVSVLNELIDVKNKFLFDSYSVFDNSEFEIIRSWPEFMEKFDG